MSKYFLQDDIARCENEKCSKKNTCARYLDVLPFELYWFSTFPDTDCDYYIEKIDEAYSKANSKAINYIFKEND